MQVISAAYFLGFLQPCFQCPSKGGQGIPREISRKLSWGFHTSERLSLTLLFTHLVLIFHFFELWDIVPLGLQRTNTIIQPELHSLGIFSFTLYFVAKVTKKWLRIQEIPCLRNKSISSWVAKLLPV